jgi:glycosyltransferase involved in cell wall biosynthesis
MRVLTPPRGSGKILPRERKRPALASAPVRVCFVIDQLARAGTETQLLALIRGLDRRRVVPYLCLLRGEDPASQALEPADCPIWRMGVGKLRSPTTLTKAVGFVRFLRRKRIDVVQTYFADSAYFALPLAWLAGVRHRIRTRNNLGHWLTPAHRLLGRCLNPLVTRTLTNCAAARRAFLESERPRPESVIVLENGVDAERFLSLPVPGEALRTEGRCVGVVANLRPVKGLDVFLRAAARVAGDRPDVHFRVAGEGPMRGALEREAEVKGLKSRFSLCGAVGDVPGFLAGLDVAVLCSHAEGMPNAVLEYMAAGRPIVATSVGAVPELIEDGEHGLLVPPNDDQALAGAIAQLLGNPDLARCLGKQARARVQQRYSRQAMIQRFEEFYTGLVGGA